MKKLTTIILITMTTISALAQQQNILLTAGGRTFTVLTDDNATARAFAGMLPLTLNMSELNGNEKYCYIDRSLPTATYRPGTIHAGDVMLYGSTCIVVFYKTFMSSYAYTKIGHIDNPAGLQEALGSGSVSVAWKQQVSDGIERTKAAAAHGGSYYDLQGNQTTRPGKGVYIHNGKKGINK